MPPTLLERKDTTVGLSPFRQQLTLFDLSTVTIAVPGKGKKKERRKGKIEKIEKAKGESVSVLRTRKGKKDRTVNNGAVLFGRKYVYQHTEYLLYCLWDSLKKREKDKFFASNKALCQYLSSEQYAVLMTECRWHFTLEDKAWLLSIMEGNKLAPLSLLLPCHHQAWALINLMPRFPYPPVLTEVYPTFFLLLLMLALWENN